MSIYIWLYIRIQNLIYYIQKEGIFRWIIYLFLTNIIISQLFLIWPYPASMQNIHDTQKEKKKEKFLILVWAPSLHHALKVEKEVEFVYCLPRTNA